MPYGGLADLVVVFHVGYVAFVVLGQLAIWAGALARQGWARNPWFRWVHLAMMTVVGLEAVAGITCPLTTLEAYLRGLAGQAVEGETFVGRLLHNLIFVDLAPAAVTALHVSFALLVIGTFVLIPPRRFGRRGRAGDETPRGTAPAKG